MRRFSMVALLLPAFLCAGCGGSAREDSGPLSGNTGWVSMEYPATDPFSTSEPDVGLSGSAFVSRDYWKCCPVDPAVTVGWKNDATGESGIASSQAYLVVGIPVHKWSATVGLKQGANLITVTAFDPGTNHGEDSITVTYTP